MKNYSMHASADAGKKLYRKGDFPESKVSYLDVYLLKKVGIFPDIIERKAKRHFEEGDHVMYVQCLSFSCVIFVFVQEKVTEEGRQEDLQKGEAHAQVALDEAAFLLDLASIEGTCDKMLPGSRT
ncbi:hypothetical protein Lal_00025810 [Lupinus albus]|nr:hypothetical protein Lal_00025810 [Lupinus albus]